MYVCVLVYILCLSVCACACICVYSCVLLLCMPSPEFDVQSQSTFQIGHSSTSLIFPAQSWPALWLSHGVDGSLLYVSYLCMYLLVSVYVWDVHCTIFFSVAVVWYCVLTTWVTKEETL